VTVSGHPQIIEAPGGKAIAFDGVGDSLLLNENPLAGAEAFTLEAVFVPMRVAQKSSVGFTYKRTTARTEFCSKHVWWVTNGFSIPISDRAKTIGRSGGKLQAPGWCLVSRGASFRRQGDAALR
jgi:hypothetical protein